MSPSLPIPEDELPEAMELIENSFPRLRGATAYEAVSQRDMRYNCIAFAAGVTHEWWEPTTRGRPGMHWPASAPKEQSVEAYVAAFGTLGYVRCDGAGLEPGFEKVVLYVSSLRRRPNSSAAAMSTDVRSPPFGTKAPDWQRASRTEHWAQGSGGSRVLAATPGRDWVDWVEGAAPRPP